MDKNLKNLVIKWGKQKEPQLGFNAFSLMSDYYYRENFHSDVLKSLLDKDGGHWEEDLFFYLFVSTLNKVKNDLKINISDFSNYSVEREKNRIDICVVDKVSKKTIIIENKINNAPDMDCQIPRYYESCTQRGLDVVAVVYWRIDRYKKPVTENWKTEQKNNIIPKLIYLDTISEDDKCFVNGVLKPVLLKSNRNDVIAVLRQYITLLEFLDGTKQINYIMKEFYNFIINENYSEILVGLHKMIDELPSFLARKISDHYSERCHPFHNTRVWGNNCAVFDDYIYQGSKHAIDVICYLDKFDFQFFVRHGCDYSEAILEEMDVSMLKNINVDRYEVVFDNPNLLEREKELFAYIDAFLDKLSKIEQ